jgi:membrane protease subunit (stomatin/prohibitin family)
MPQRRHPETETESEMPGLLRGVARTAVIAGTATSVSNRVSRRQEGRWAQQEQQQWEQEQQRMAAQAPPQQAAAPAQAADPVAELKKLGELHESGVLTDEEFAAAKAKIINV